MSIETLFGVIQMGVSLKAASKGNMTCAADFNLAAARLLLDASVYRPRLTATAPADYKDRFGVTWLADEMFSCHSLLIFNHVDTLVAVFCAWRTYSIICLSRRRSCSPLKAKSCNNPAVSM
jgi:hypothetical protein